MTTSTPTTTPSFEARMKVLNAKRKAERSILKIQIDSLKRLDSSTGLEAAIAEFSKAHESLCSSWWELFQLAGKEYFSGSVNLKKTAEEKYTKLSATLETAISIRAKATDMLLARSTSASSPSLLDDDLKIKDRHKVAPQVDTRRQPAAAPTPQPAKPAGNSTPQLSPAQIEILASLDPPQLLAALRGGQQYSRDARTAPKRSRLQSWIDARTPKH